MKDKKMYVTDNYGEFTRHIVSLMTGSELRNTMSAMARKLGERFDRKKAARKLHDTIE